MQAEKAQKLALLATVNNGQTRVLIEIFHNLAQLPHSGAEKGVVESKRKTLFKLGSVHAKLGFMKANLWRHRRQVVEILQLFRHQLELLLETVAE